MSTILNEYMKTPTSSLSITANGTYDVTEKAEAVVNVPNPSTGNIDITASTSTQTGIDVSNYATASVNPTPTQTKSASYTANGSYTVTPDSGYDLSSVSVTVAIPVYNGEVV